MPDSDVYRKTEGILFCFAKAKANIGRLEYELDEIERQREYLRLLYVTNHAKPGKLTARYGGIGGAKTGKSKLSPIEQSVIAAEGDKERIKQMYDERTKQRDEKLEELHKLRTDAAPVEYAYQQLSRDEQEFFIQRYHFKETNVAIGRRLHCDERTIRRRRDALVSKMAQLLGVAQ